MNNHSPIKPPASLLERASEIYDFRSALRSPEPPAADPAPVAVEPQPDAQHVAAPQLREAVRAPNFHKLKANVDRERLRASNYIVPEGPVTGLSEEFRIVKRQLLLAARGGKGFEPLRMANVS